MGAECGNKKLFEGDVSSGIDLGGHLPSAESAGIAAVAAAGLNTGPVLELDLVVVLKSNAGNSNIEILFTVISRQIELSRPPSTLSALRTRFLFA